MKNGFYHLQDQYAGSIPAFLKALDDIESDINVQFKSGESMVAPVSVASFMLGFCGELAMYFNRKYGFEIGILRDEDHLHHVFNVISPSPTKRYFLDARGITDDVSLFLEPYSLLAVNCLYAKDIESAQALAPDGEWYFPEDEISDAMIAWLLNTYPDYYDPSPLLPRWGQALTTAPETIDSTKVTGMNVMFCDCASKKNALEEIIDSAKTKTSTDKQETLPHTEPER